jgi:hypothetical protein
MHNPEPSKLAAIRPTANAPVWTIQLPNGQQYGPLSESEIQSLIESGVIPASSLAWNAQVGSWQRVVDVMSSVVANHSDVLTSPPPRLAPTTSSSIEPALTQLFDHINGDRQHAERERQQQGRARVATANEIKSVSEWAGKAVAAGVGIVLVVIAVFAWAGAGPQNFNLGRVALLPILFAGATAALVSWILPYFYSSRGRRK